VWHNAFRLSEEPPLEAAGARFEAIDPNPEVVVNQLRWKCYLLSLLRIHSPDCECRNARETSGEDMRKRLEELNWRTQPRSLNNRDQGEVLGGFDSKPGEVVASPPISLKARKRKKKIA